MVKRVSILKAEKNLDFEAEPDVGLGRNPDL
jgi:hypothetical protein